MGSAPKPVRCTICDRHLRWWGGFLGCLRCDAFVRELTHTQKGVVH